MVETRIETGVVAGNMEGCMTAGVDDVVAVGSKNGVAVSSTKPVGAGASRVALISAPQAELKNRAINAVRDNFTEVIRLDYRRTHLTR